ncbi:MAG: Flp pilus assembly protein CpaB [Candidatus Omnitrophica bacterium]|nr:Flp pilus assembly protein CpaB [Candidatus Omnitrophota bacterium]
MDKRLLNILIGVGIAIIAIFMIMKEMQKREDLIRRLIEEGKIVEVVIARTDISKETVIDPNMVELKREPRSSMQPGDLTSLDSVIKKFAVVDILKGQHVNDNMVRAADAFKFLSQTIEGGMRAFTIPVDNITAIEGLIKPGDRVDVIGTFSFPAEKGGQSLPIVVTLFQGVKVLATNRNISPYTISTRAGTITMALRPEDVRMFAYCLEVGRIRLVLRAPLDTEQEFEYTAVTFEALLKKIGMYSPQPTTPTKVTQSVEIYEGSKEKKETTLPER